MVTTIKDHWKNRRIMAYGAWAVGLFVFPALVFATENASLVEIAVPLYALITFILTAYYAVATWDDADERRYNQS